MSCTKALWCRTNSPQKRFVGDSLVSVDGAWEDGPLPAAHPVIGTTAASFVIGTPITTRSWCLGTQVCRCQEQGDCRTDTTHFSKAAAYGKESTDSEQQRPAAAVSDKTVIMPTHPEAGALPNDMPTSVPRQYSNAHCLRCNT